MKPKYLSWEDVVSELVHDHCVEPDLDRETLEALAEEYGYYEHADNEWLLDD